MKNIQKTILILMSFFLLVGCQETKSEPPVEKPYTFQYFYISSCNLCDAFKEEGIPLIEEELGDQVSIEAYNLDDDETKEIYDEVLSKIRTEDFERDYYGIAPFVVFDGHFARLGIYPGDYELLIEDMKKAMNNEPISYELSYNRVLFKDTKTTVE